MQIQKVTVKTRSFVSDAKFYNRILHCATDSLNRLVEQIIETVVNEIKIEWMEEHLFKFTNSR